MRRIFFLVLSFFFCLLPFGHALEIGLNAENLPDLVSYLPDMGIRSVRIMVRWQAVEPYENPTEEARARLTGENREAIERMRRRGIVIAPPVQDLDTNGFYWEKYDERFEAAQRSGLDVLFTLRATSLWGTVQKARLGTKGGYVVASRPKDMQRWKDFVAAFVSRYKGRGVRVFYEVENEVNAKAFWTGSPEDYVALLKETYQTIKASDPSARVLHAAMACGMTKDARGPVRAKGLERHDGFLRRIFDSRAFDIISTHDYYFPDQAVNGFTFGSYLDHIKALAAEYGVADRPLWVTENGYVTVPTKVGARMDPGSIGAQSRWLEGAVVQASDAGVDRMFWMLIADRDEPYFGTMGLLENDGTSRPVCAVVRRVNEGGVKLDQR